MITIYDRTHAFVGATYSYSGLCLEEKVDTGDKTLTFTYERFGSEIIYQYPRLLRYRQPQSISSHVFLDDYFSQQVVLEDFQIETEYYVVYDGQEYVVKQIQGDKITCILNLEWLRCAFFKDFQFKYQLYGNVGHYEVRLRNQPSTAGPDLDFFHDFINESDDSAVIDGTTYYWWSKRMPGGIAEGDGLDIVYALCDAYMYEPVFDTLNKQVHFYERVGSDRGVEFRKGLNLKSVNKKIDSYDFFTVIYPVGKNGLEIDNPNHPTYYPTPTGDTSTAISDNVVCDFSYANKTRVYHWHDENYSDADMMKADAEKLLADMSHPIVSYEVKVRDLADFSSDYSRFAFGLGDVITIIDPDTQTYEKQRIIGMKTYPQNRDQDSLTIANTMMTWQEIQAKLASASKVVGQVSHNGKIMLSGIEDILPIEGEVAPASTYTSSYTVNSLRRQLSQVSMSIRISKNISAGSTVNVGTIPYGFRPSNEVAFYGTCSSTGANVAATVTITEQGAIRVKQYGAASTWVQFDVSWATEDDVPE